MQQAIDNFKRFYADLRPEGLDGLADLYCRDANFSDPLHCLQGLEAITGYFRAATGGLRQCRFEFDRELYQGRTLLLEWRMFYVHPALRGGRPLCLRGTSVVDWREESPGRFKVMEHRDYYDMGAMIYEQLPVIGWLVRVVKNRLQRNTGAEN